MAISPFPQGLCPGDAVSTPAANWQDQALIYDYRQAANPIRPGLTEPIPYQKWSAPAWEGSSSRIVPLDLSAALGCDGPATSPGLAAHFLQVCPGDPLSPQALATSSLFYVCSGGGRLAFPGQTDPLAVPLEWAEGDVFVLPHGLCPELSAHQPSLLYWVHDAPLLRYLGVSPVGRRFSPCYFSADRLDHDLNQLLADPSAARSNRLSVLLAHADLPATRTVTHTLWAMLGVVPPGLCRLPIAINPWPLISSWLARPAVTRWWAPTLTRQARSATPLGSIGRAGGCSSLPRDSGMPMSTTLVRPPVCCPFRMRAFTPT
jgi:hypothetical protein